MGHELNQPTNQPTNQNNKFYFISSAPVTEPVESAATDEVDPVTEQGKEEYDEVSMLKPLKYCS